MKVLVFIEQRFGKIKASSHEAISAALDLAQGQAANVSGVLIGKGTKALCAQLKGEGISQVYVADGDAFDLYNQLNYTQAVSEAVKASGAEIVVGVASPMGRDIFPRLAAKHDGAILTDLVKVEAAGSSVKGLKPMYSGKVLASVEASAPGLKVVSLRPNVFPAKKPGSGDATPVDLNVSNLSSNFKTLEIRKGKSEKADLTEAGVIVSGGRALASADNFKILFELGDAVGATVGASRAAVDSGYASHDMQVGQTGKTVNPNLYIAFGISGSIQHMAGMRTSKVIVAVNTDPEAPIFTIADYGIVGDLFTAAPLFTQKFKKLLGH